MSEDNHETMLTNTSLVFNQQQSTSYSSLMLTTAASYSTTNNFNINNSYNSRFKQYQSNLFSINCQNWYKCNSSRYTNIKQFQKCLSCHNVCCISCLSTYRLSTSSFYRCENCCLDLALQITYC